LREVERKVGAELDKLKSQDWHVVHNLKKDFDSADEDARERRRQQSCRGYRPHAGRSGCEGAAFAEGTEQLLDKERISLGKPYDFFCTCEGASQVAVTANPPAPSQVARSSPVNFMKFPATRPSVFVNEHQRTSTNINASAALVLVAGVALCH
jgi:hypothetical protein